MDPIQTAFPNGHFYSPVVDPAEIAARETQIWPAQPQIQGVDFNDEGHIEVMRDLFPRFIKQYDYPEHLPEVPSGRPLFHTQNSQFSWLDSRSLFVLLRAWQPRRLIEVGSGFSTLLMADVNSRHLGDAIDLTSIEPYPRDFLRQPIPGLGQLIEAKVQDVPLDEFLRLGPGDVLFIDSSHISKTGSDVNYLYFEVLPRLAKGVRIHIHDIFLPHDYPPKWVSTENRSWNEQYLLRALLMHSIAFRVLFGCSYAFWRFPELVASALSLPGGGAFGGGSFWIERT